MSYNGCLIPTGFLVTIVDVNSNVTYSILIGLNLSVPVSITPIEFLNELPASLFFGFSFRSREGFYSIEKKKNIKNY